ncbi:MAG: sulfatase-like hydrolase/transferase [Planctomycetes bacterium]|nr:sulfatase-like hydrolase/transferase [Planctomycetota bacterium]
MNSPNILWICTDQQRFDTLGCYGNRFVHTPNVDRLAQTGVLFEHAYCQNPVSTPSRASFLTGRYPRTTRCRQNGQSIPQDEVLITRLLADAGYTCGLSGKLHLSACHPSVCPVTERRTDDGYPLYGPSDRLGGEGSFREMVEAVHDAGHQIMVHTCLWGADPGAHGCRATRHISTGW